MDRSEVDAKAGAEALLAAECFRVPFKGDAHLQIYRQVQALRRDADIAIHYSPYSALVQSSCFGKTRAVMEMSELGVYVCYCSLAGKESSAYPPRTDFLADRLAGSSTELEMVLYLQAWLLVLIDALEKRITAVEWKEQQMPGGGVAKAVREKWEQLIASTPAMAPDANVDRDDANLQIIRKTLDRARELGMNSLSDVDEMDSDSNDMDVVEYMDPSVIFVFDEARGLTTPSDVPFAQLRRALRVFFDWPAYFALMLDTSATVSNFLPRKCNEDSSRALKIGISLLLPIYHVPTLELNAPRSGLDDVNEYTSPSTWLKYGRPVWAARMAKDGSDEAVLRRKLLPWAQQKLMGDINDEFYVEGRMTESQAMALLAAATGLQVCARCPLAEKMAASHMNVLLRVTRDRSRVFVALPVEPILSEAASNLLRNERVKRNALMHMEAACMAGYATGGPRGEFTAKFILASAVWDMTPSGSWYLRPINVRDFFDKVLVNTKRDVATRRAFKTVASRLPDRGIIFFNGFVVVRKAPDEAMLSRCFAAGRAIMYQAENNMPGGDVVLPIWTPRGMTFAIISVKNQENKGWWEGPSLESLRCEFTGLKVCVDLPVVTLLMSVKEPNVASPKAWLLWDGDDERYVQLTCYGIDGNYGYLSNEVKSLLKAILITRPDPIQGADPFEACWVKKVMPHQYMDLPSFVLPHH